MAVTEQWNNYWTNGICGNCAREHVTVMTKPRDQVDGPLIGLVATCLEWFEEMEETKVCRCRPSEWRLAPGPAVPRAWTPSTPGF